MLETKSQFFFNQNGKEAKFSCFKKRFGQFACNLPPQQSENGISGFKMPFSAKSLGVNGLILADPITRKPPALDILFLTYNLSHDTPDQINLLCI